jgi:hypothetical protein
MCETKSTLQEQKSNSKELCFLPHAHANVHMPGSFTKNIFLEQSLISAAEAAEMIIRVDEVVTCAPRQRAE